MSANRSARVVGRALLLVSLRCRRWELGTGEGGGVGGWGRGRKEGGGRVLGGGGIRHEAAQQAQELSEKPAF